MAEDENLEEGFWAALWRESLMAMSLGWDLALPIFGGVLLGSFLDRWLRTGYTFTLGLLMLGVMVSFYNLARFIRRTDRITADIDAAEAAETDETTKARPE